MRMEDGTKFKKAMSMVTLVLAFVALVVASIGASFSFAWFSEYSTAQVQEVNFNSQAVTNIGFTGPGSGEAHGAYLGQKAFDETGKLILGNEEGQTPVYYADKAYECSVPITVTANNQTIGIKITGVDIIISGVQTPITPGNIPYGFTFYMMSQKTQKIANKNAINVYTPYGKAEQVLELQADGYTPVEGDYVLLADNNTFKKYTEKEKPVGTYFKKGTINNFENKQSSTETEPRNFTLHNFNLDVEGETFDFYVVFCPQELYWSQYLAAGNINVTNYYDQTELNKIYYNDGASDNINQLFYSKNSYKGSQFQFNVWMGASA